MQHFVKIKPLQLFLYLSAPGLVAVVAFILCARFGSCNAYKYLFLILTFPLVIYFLWIFSIVSKFSNKVTVLFKIALLIVAICTEVFIVSLEYNFFSKNLLVVFKYTGFVSHTYILYYTARVIRQAEFDRQPELSELIVDIIAIYILPIGLWVVQPRVNAVLAKRIFEAEK